MTPDEAASHESLFWHRLKGMFVSLVVLKCLTRPGMYCKCRVATIKVINTRSIMLLTQGRLTYTGKQCAFHLKVQLAICSGIFKVKVLNNNES